MRTDPRRLLPALLALALAAAALPPAEAGAARTRSGGSDSKASAAGRGSGDSAGATRSAGRRSGEAARTATGRATWRQGRGVRHRHHGHHYGYYGHPWFGYYPYGWYGYPYYGYWPWDYGYRGYDPRYGVGDRGLPETPAVVLTEVRPKRARVLLDGEEVGQARDYNGNWDTLLVEPGVRELTFEAEGYQTLRVRLDARPGRRYVVHERLRRGEGLDPRSSREAPDTARGEAPPDRAPPRADATGPGGDPAPGALRQGLLRLRVRPDDAAVYLDGSFLARADELARLHGAIPVASGRHVVEVVRPGYVSRSVDVEVQGREPVEVTVELERRR